MEIWKKVIGYENYYEVSNYGRIRSIPCYRPFKSGVKVYRQKYLKPSLVNGYERITLYKDKKYVKILVHVLVAKHFIPNPNNYDQINHKDFNRTNNKVDNLEWVNHRMNQVHSLSRRSTSSIYPGVSYCKKNSKWLSKIQHKKKQTYLGYFLTEEEAYQAYLKALESI
jgi:hypothetical protein